MIAKRVSSSMKQLGLGLNLTTKRKRKREFLDEMNRVVPWAALVAVVEPHAPRAKTGRPPFASQTMLCRRRFKSEPPCRFKIQY